MASFLARDKKREQGGQPCSFAIGGCEKMWARAFLIDFMRVTCACVRGYEMGRGGVSEVRGKSEK